MLLARAGGLEGFARHVVIKRLRPEMAKEARLAEAFLEEARIAGSLHHQNIVTVHDIGEQDGAYFFAMEYVHGEDARKLIGKVRGRGEHIPLEHALSIVMATAAGLHHAHEQASPTGERLGLVHRDIAPANILIGYDGSVKIVDFGMAKAVARSTGTMTGLLKGKASYMSPEQCTGKPIDRRTDIFALGVVLYELITAQRLFKGVNDFMTMAAIVEGEIPRPSSVRREVPAALDAIILRALERSPDSRYQSAEAMRESLEAFALANELRTSGKALADYLLGLFGQRPEPWEPAAKDTPFVDIDPEGTNAKGLVQAPPSRPQDLLARLSVRSESPMMQADAADGEWSDDDEDARTEAVGRTLASSRAARESNDLRTEPNPSLAASMKDAPFGGATITSPGGSGQTILDATITRTGPTGQTILDATVTETGVDMTSAAAGSPGDSGQMPSKLISAATRTSRGEELESRTLVEPPAFDGTTDAVGSSTEDFAEEAATEASTGDDLDWIRAQAGGATQAHRTSAAIIPRASLAKRLSTAATPETQPTAAPAPARPAPAPAPRSLPAPKPAPPPKPMPAPAPLPAPAPIIPVFPPRVSAPPPRLPPPVAEAGAAPAGMVAPPMGQQDFAPLPADLVIRGKAHAFVLKHQTRLWLAGGVLLVLLVIIAARGCGDEHSSVELRSGHAAEHEGT